MCGDSLAASLEALEVVERIIVAIGWIYLITERDELRRELVNFQARMVGSRELLVIKDLIKMKGSVPSESHRIRDPLYPKEYKEFCGGNDPVKSLS